MHPPLVMQTFWRTRGTYFWSLFRQQEGIRAYYEPLHEDLAIRTDQQWSLDFLHGGIRALRHPKVESHYFSEYPIRPEGGVALFHRALAFDNFMLTERDDCPALAAYLHSLVDHAAQHGERAFFKFTRGGLRAGYIRRTIGGVHFFLNRPPSEIHESFRSYGPSSYFTAVVVYLAVRYADRVFCAAALEILRALGPFDEGPLRARLREGPVAAEPVAAQLTRTQSEMLVATFWLAYLLEGLAAADIVIDTERLGCDAECCRSTGALLAVFLNRDPLASYRGGACADDFMRYAPLLRAIVAADGRLRALAGSLLQPSVAALGNASRRLLEAAL